MKKVTFLLFLLISFLLTPEKLWACQCVAPVLETEDDFRLSVSTFLNRADAVFAGEVTEMDRFTIKFKALDVWKGDLKEEITLLTGAYIGLDGTIVSSRCGPQFEVGKSYLVFARGSKDELQAERCAWTGLLSDAERVVSELDAIRRIGTILSLPKSATITVKFNNSLNRTRNKVVFHL